MSTENKALCLVYFSLHTVILCSWKWNMCVVSDPTTAAGTVSLTVVLFAMFMEWGEGGGLLLLV